MTPITTTRNLTRSSNAVAHMYWFFACNFLLLIWYTSAAQQIRPSLMCASPGTCCAYPHDKFSLLFVGPHPVNTPQIRSGVKERARTLL